MHSDDAAYLLRKTRGFRHLIRGRHDAPKVHNSMDRLHADGIRGTQSRTLSEKTSHLGSEVVIRGQAGAACHRRSDGKTRCHRTHQYAARSVRRTACTQQSHTFSFQALPVVGGSHNTWALANVRVVDRFVAGEALAFRCRLRAYVHRHGNGSERGGHSCGTGANAGCSTSIAGTCSGTFDAFSFDAYADAMYSGVHNGVANGNLYCRTNINPMIGVSLQVLRNGRPLSVILAPCSDWIMGPLLWTEYSSTGACGHAYD